MGLIFTLLNFFSMFGLMALISGYDFFHAKNPSGSQTIPFLIFGGAALFLGFHLIKAFTDPLPAWWPLPTSYREPETDGPKRLLFKVFAIVYVVCMTVFTGLIIGPRLGFSPERIALLLGFGLLAGLLLLFFFDVFHAIYLFRKDRKTPSAESPSVRS